MRHTFLHENLFSLQRDFITNVFTLNNSKNEKNSNVCSVRGCYGNVFGS